MANADFHIASVLYFNTKNPDLSIRIRKSLLLKRAPDMRFGVMIKVAGKNIDIDLLVW